MQANVPSPRPHPTVVGLEAARSQIRDRVGRQRSGQQWVCDRPPPMVSGGTTPPILATRPGLTTGTIFRCTGYPENPMSSGYRQGQVQNALLSCWFNLGMLRENRIFVRSRI